MPPKGRQLVQLLGKLRAKYEAALQPLGRKIGGSGLRPNTITTLSLLVSLLAAYCYFLRTPILGGLGLLAAGFIDMLDGAVAGHGLGQ